MINNDGGGADYITNAAPCSLHSGEGDGGTQVGLVNSSKSLIGCALIDLSSIGFVVTPQLFGFVGGGIATSAVDTNAFQAALDTGLTVHFPALVTNVQQFVVNSTKGSTCLTINTPYQHIYGDGPNNSQITILPGRSICRGIISFNRPGSAGPNIEQIGLQFGQADPFPGYSKLNQYPPGFYLRDAPGFSLVGNLCYQAWVCVDMRGNSGGAIIRDFRFNAWSIGINIDGAQGSILLDNLYWVPNGMTATQQDNFYGQQSQGNVRASYNIHNAGNGVYLPDPSSLPVNFAFRFPQIGEYRLVFTSSAAFNIFEPDGRLIGPASVGAPVKNELNFSISRGSIPWAANDEIDLTVTAFPPIGALIGRMDDIHIHNSIFLGGIGTVFYYAQKMLTPYSNGGGGAGGGEITSVDYDTASGILQYAGNLEISAATVSVFPQDAVGIDFEGGILNISTTNITTSRSAATLDNPGKPLIRLSSLAGASMGSFSMSNSIFALGNTDNQVILQDGAVTTALIGNKFQLSCCRNYSYPIIAIHKGRLTAIGNYAFDGSGIFIGIMSGGDSPANRVIGNSGNGWLTTVPSMPLGVYQFN